MSKKVASFHEQYKSDAGYRIKVSLYSNIAMNVAYAILQMCLGFKHHTVWFYSLAGYHIILALVRDFAFSAECNAGRFCVLHYVAGACDGTGFYADA